MDRKRKGMQPHSATYSQAALVSLLAFLIERKKEGSSHSSQICMWLGTFCAKYPFGEPLTKTESLTASRCFSNSTERRGTTPMTSLFLLVRSLVGCYAVLRVIPFSSLKLLREDRRAGVRRSARKSTDNNNNGGNEFLRHLGRTFQKTGKVGHHIVK
ncbi:hypothetical protein YC2023_048280 [Brassica napus]